MGGPSDKNAGGAESFARHRQYDYRATSTLVLTSDHKRGDRGPTGEPETLANRKLPKMGDRAARTAPEGIDELRKKKRQEDEQADDLLPRKRQRESVLDIDMQGVYRPKSRETRRAYELLLSMIQVHLGDQPAEILHGAADEVLAILKDENKKDPDKQQEVQELFGADIGDDFHKYVVCGKQITDYSAEGEETRDVDDDYGVAVDLEDDDDDDARGTAAEVVASDDDEEGDDGGAAAANLTANMDLDGDDGDGDGLKVTDIDAYWLQRAISEAYTKSGEPLDAPAAQDKDRQVLQLLASTRSVTDLETALVDFLGFERFELIKAPGYLRRINAPGLLQTLIANGAKIVWCTRLARAKSDADRAEVEREMFADASLTSILGELKATRASARERQNAMQRSIREEARALRAADAAGGGAEVVDRDVAARKALDLKSLEFQGGAHSTLNKSVKLPKETFRRLEKGYEEVCIPAPKAKSMGAGEKLIPVKSLPDWAQPAFKGMTSLNRIQSRVCETALHSSNNILMCAPTGAGKTNVAMLTILHTLGQALQPDGSINKDKFKIVYIAPMKALVAEMVGNFQKRLDERYGIVTRELTGDISLSKAQIEETQIIVTTPEKWDIITRKSGDRLYTSLVKLLIIDEVHLLHDDRGPVLESIIARMLRQVESTAEMVRLVGLSATLPNYEDVARVLRVKRDNGLFFFDASYRPCPLAQTFIGVTVKKPLQRFQLMNEICYKKIMDAAGKHQVMIFVHSRKETVKTAKYLRDKALEEEQLSKFMRAEATSREILQSQAEETKDAGLADLLPYGFGVHHAGMKRADRTTVEDLFADGHIQVLVSTATLAWGVNLPAHTVIIKGTQVYNPVRSGWGELSPQDVMQMLGRAGRPQYDSFGEGIIITQHSELHYYLSLLNEQLPIESQFVKKLPDALNAEIVLGTVQNLREAANWLGYTYLYVRMMKKPQQYGVPLADVDDDPNLLARRKDLIHSAALELDRHNLVRYDRKTGNFQTTDLGRIASQYYITYTTLREFNEHLKPTMGEIELLRIFSLADEFKYMVVRDEEKLELVKLSQRVPIPIKESIEEPTAKINVLLQAYISGLKLDGLALMADLVYVQQSAGRLMRCLYEICMRRNWVQLTEKALHLCKAVSHRMWPSQTPLRQFKGKLKLTTQVLANLEKKEIPWERYFDMKPVELGELVRVPKLGKFVHKLVNMVPKLSVETAVQPITRGLLRVDLVITPDFRWNEDYHGYVEPFIIMVEDQDSEFVLHHEYFFLKMQNALEDRVVDHLVSFTVPLHDPLPPQYFIRIISDRWLGSEQVVPVTFRNLILPDKFHPPAELLDLQPLPLSALRNKAFEALYPDLTHFNPIQTQVFSTLFGADDASLVAAPTGSGKTICAEFAILRMIQQHEAKAREAEEDDRVIVPPLRAVYVAPLPAIAHEKFRDWSKRFGDAGLGLNVVQLTGEWQSDAKLLARGNIVVATAEHWDRASRRWRQRKAVSELSLFIADELHLLGSETGPTMEVIISRMRAITRLLSKPIRMLGLASSIANAKDVGEWLGCPSQCIFNFPPGVRPVPLEIHIQSTDVANFEARLQAMSRPTYNAVLQYAKNKPAIVFAPTRKHAKQMAADLMMYSASDSQAFRFLHVAADTLDPFVDRVSDAALKQSLLSGIGILHDTMSQEEQDIVSLLFERGALQVLVVTASMCWAVSTNAKLVVVMGTQYYDSSGLGGSDFPVSHLLQMLGRASRPLKDDSGVCVLMCHSAKKEYYKKFLFEPLPIESHLDTCLQDHMVAEIVVKTIQSKQDAVDWLTYTFFYRRLPQNPNYYNMMGKSHRHIRDHLSELVEDVCAELHDAHAVLLDESGLNLSPENLGIIASYHHISFKTLATCHEHLTAKVKMKSLLALLTHAREFESLPLRPGEEHAIQRLLKHARFAVADMHVDAKSKANALLQAHFARTPLRGDLLSDQRSVLQTSMRLLHAIVDVVSSKNILSVCLCAMEMCQMVTQGMLDKDSVLLQIPGFTRDLASKCEKQGKRDILSLQDMEEADRRELLAMDDEEYSRVAVFCNRYPDIQLQYTVANGRDTTEGGGDDEDEARAFQCDGDVDEIVLQVDLLRESESGPVHAPRYPGTKDEHWWLVCGDSDNNVLAIKRLAFDVKHKTSLRIDTFQPGTNDIKLFFMCDSYLGCDQEYEFTVTVGDAGAAMETD